MTHDEAQRLLSAYADGGLDGAEREAMEAHIASCTACADEVTTVRALLVEVRRLPAATEQDDAFFRDFGREVRLAYERAESKSIWTWLRKPALIAGFCAAAALILGVVIMRRGTTSDRPELAASRALPEVIVDQEDLSPVELARALAALDVELDLTARLRDEETAMVPSGGAEQSLESLDDAALQRLDREL
jgi:anti-sigma factor RsiW